ncbi:transcriptional regulator MraZ [Butyrivibrio sp. X503]|uniref:division/cell wall cluster transcriptional repressor MraZ n=1 Tax=unclassified Butyrivibrio TaxID=2639466 RepID=UPI000EA856AC|nr:MULTISPECIES: division/cell wall cluster transcriptional repressor MraZ [unclassified Butyrivibrio]RKM55678.1 transcriptional regulator MraZ [Butyrivibrio sp. X503]RKM62998.1 transcriptional regulator MraZ [Butyrivibrio sp. XB500-5]
MGTAFRGEYSHSIDAKGRLIIPAKFRELLGEQFVVTKGFDGCLFVFAQEGWDKFEEKLQSLPMDKPEARMLGRFFIAGAIDAETDKQGRILIPANLLQHAGIEKEAVIAGVGNRAEIWSKTEWEKASSFEDINGIAAKMSEYGLSI